MKAKKGKRKQIKLKPIKLETSRRQTKHGSYSVTLTAIVVAGAVAANLLVSEIPSQYTKIDTTSQQLSVLSEQSTELLSSLSKDMTLYYIVQDGNEDSYVERLLERYEDASSHLTVVKKDPVLYPKFTSQYTDESLSENSLILVCGEQSRVISYDDMYESEFNYNYYTYQTTGFDAEGQITSAIAAFNSGDQPKVYTLTGHSETSIGSTLQDSVTKENIELESLNLISAEAVPDDADALMIVSPQSDITEEEKTKILDYMEAGGRAVIITDYTGVEMPNLEAVLEAYQISITDGVVVEGNTNYYVQMPYYLLPDVNSTEVTDGLTGGAAYVLLAAAQGLEKDDEVRDGLTLTSVLDTSDTAYSKVDVEGMNTFEKEEGDVDGPFSVGMIASETVEAASTEEETEDETEAAEAVETAETRLAVFTTSSLIDESANQMVSGGNFRLFINTLSWICGNESSVSIPVKSLSMDYLTVPSASGSFWAILTIIVIPGGFLIFGLYTWLKRRKR